MSLNLKGTGVAVVTPFHTDQTVNFSELETIINHLLDNGVNYIVSLGTTGESVTLNKTEKLEVIHKTIDFINGRAPIIVGSGGNNTNAVIEDIKVLNTIEAIDGYLSVSPYYSKPSQKGIYEHYQAISKNTDKGIVLYNVPGRTSKNIDAQTALDLAHDCDNVIAIKEAANNMVQSQFLTKHKPNGFHVISGDDDLVLAQMAIGFDGVISVVGNAYPKLWSDMIYQASENNYDVARQINFALQDFVKFIFAENNPAGIKCAMKHLNICSDQLRLPLVNVETELETKIKAFVETLEL